MKPASSSDLRQHWPDVLACLRNGSPLSVPLRRALVEFLEIRLEGSQAQARSARERSRARSERIGAAVAAAYAGLGGRKLSAAELTTIVQRRLQASPKRYGVKSAPDISVTRRHVRKLEDLGSEVIAQLLENGAPARQEHCDE